DIIKDGVGMLPAGITTEMVEKEDKVDSATGEMVNVVEYWFTFPKSYIASLPASPEEYCITFDVTDGKGFANSKKLRFARAEEAIERQAPVGSYTQEEISDFTAITPNSAVLRGAIYDSSVTDFGFRIREQGADNWTSLSGTLDSDASATRADSKLKKYSAVATGLKPGTIYEYKAYAGDFEEALPKTFKTESVFVIPNASLEDWSDFSENSKVLLPGAGGVRTFWDSGNHGSATMSVTLTKGIDSPKHSGNHAAQLRSQFVGIGVAGKFAAGNLFVGEYLETQGTDGRLQFGREYNGSHPSALRLWANYRPGTVEKPGSIADCEASVYYTHIRAH
ncbi:MAG: PCMD domain-containing protein, partial [Muribaculaceae bacterium]|nr:PCMD domain-containing protein [Muribaculaceae bacterium]